MMLEVTNLNTEISGMETSLDKEAVMRRVFWEDCYLFDLQQRGLVFACRAPVQEHLLGVELTERISEKEWTVMTEHLFRLTEIPLICRAGGRLCVLIPSLAGSTSLGLLLFPRIEESRFLCLAKRDASFFAFAPGCEPPFGCRMSARTREYLPAYEEMLLDIKSCFCDLTSSAPYGAEQDVTEWLIRRVRSLSYFCGCPVELKGKDALIDRGDLDRPLFTCFVLIGFLLARRMSLSREAEMCLEQDPNGCLVKISFEMTESEEDLPTEHIILHQIAAGKNIPFEGSYRNRHGVLRLLPMQIDWSYLGLKQNEK